MWGTGSGQEERKVGRKRGKLCPSWRTPACIRHPLPLLCRRGAPSSPLFLPLPWHQPTSLGFLCFLLVLFVCLFLK